ncbi:MAG: hypothetical protein ACC662_11615, partial [Planctomycetota bacterium]
MTLSWVALLAATRTELGGWRFSNLPPGWVLTVVVLVLFVFVRGLYRRERGRASGPLRWGLAALRTVILLLLLLVLAGPYREEVTVSEERAHLVVLVDASGSMKTVDHYGPAEERRLRQAAWPDGRDAPPEEGGLDVSRLDLVKRVLAPQGEAILR